MVKHTLGALNGMNIDEARGVHERRSIMTARGCGLRQRSQISS
jgi:hypothetical protein